MTWVLLWKIVLLISLLLFAVVAVVTTIGGASDIRKLFRRLREDEQSK